ncbi:MAG: hypothetical protein ACREA0_03790 [bacterium]
MRSLLLGSGRYRDRSPEEIFAPPFRHGWEKPIVSSEALIYPPQADLVQHALHQTAAGAIKSRRW